MKIEMLGGPLDGVVVEDDEDLKGQLVPYNGQMLYYERADEGGPLRFLGYLVKTEAQDDE